MSINKNIQQIVEVIHEHEKNRKFMNFYQTAVSKNTKVTPKTGFFQKKPFLTGLCLGACFYRHKA